MFRRIALFVRHRFLRMENLYAVHICEVFNGFGICPVVELHHEVYAVSVCAATEAVIRVAVRTHNEGAGLLIVERA